MPDPFNFPPEPGDFRNNPFSDAQGNNPFADQGESAASDEKANPYASSGRYYSPYQPTGYETMYPHRGPLVLSLGIGSLFAALISVAISFICCPVLPVLALTLSLPAWMLGSADMRAINSGSMDPQGRGMTQAGQVLGIVSTLLIVAGLLLIVGWIVMAVSGAM